MIQSIEQVKEFFAVYLRLERSMTEEEVKQCMKVIELFQQFLVLESDVP